MVSPVIVLCQNYPSERNPYAMSYVHSRVKSYLKSGVPVQVLSFSATAPYSYDGVLVCDEKAIAKHINARTVFLSHAPNIKNHIRFLSCNLSKARQVIFFFHGHEVMRRVKDYPRPYSWKRRSFLGEKLTDFYDGVKLFIMRFFLFLYQHKTKVVFVSEWMMRVFYQRVKPYQKSIRYDVINNPVNDGFVVRAYNSEAEKEYDFITIRPLDESKYCIDLVVSAARNEPDKQFLVVGKGDFFNHEKNVPPNLTWWDRFFEQSEIPDLLDRCKCALMPTRLDAQGVMSCEIATYGMPIVTSAIPICKEMLSGFRNVAFVDNESFGRVGLSELVPAPSQELNSRFHYSNTTLREIGLVKGQLKDS